MEHTYAALLLNETNEELNERNLSAVLDAAGVDATASRTKALVAALEGVDLDGVAPSFDAETVAGDDLDELDWVGDGDAEGGSEHDITME